MKNNDEIIVCNTLYKNDVGRAIIVDPDYKGFPGKKGLLVKFSDRENHYGFVHHESILAIKHLDPERQAKAPIGSFPKINKTVLTIDKKLTELDRVWKNPNDYFSPAYVPAFRSNDIRQRPMPTHRETIRRIGEILTTSDFVDENNGLLSSHSLVNELDVPFTPWETETET